MVWKEWAELRGNPRALRVFALAVGVMGVLPVLETGRSAHLAVRSLFLAFYVLLACAIVVAQAGPDLVLRERNGHTLEYLLASRLGDGAIFGGKVVTATLLGYAAAALTLALQLAVVHLRPGGGAAAASAGTWLYLATPAGRLLALGGPLLLAPYAATVGTSVALRVGDQRAAYLVTMLCIAALTLPFVLHLVTPRLEAGWLERAAAVFAGLDAALVSAARALFRRHRLVLYLQE